MLFKYLIEICILVIICYFSCFSSVEAYGQLSFTMDTFVSKALSMESELMKVINNTEIINEIDYEISKSSYVPSASFSINGPTYSKNISPITQPDGSVVYRQVNSLNESLSINVSVPICKTGGNLSLQSGASAYEHFSNGMSSVSLSMNYFSFSISQPLNFYSESKWGKRLMEALNEKNRIESIDAYYDERIDCIKQYFNMLICESRRIQLRNEYEFYVQLLERLEREVLLGRILEIELSEVKLKCKESLIMLEEITDEMNCVCDRIYSTYSVLVDDASLWICPEFPQFDYCLDSVKIKLREKCELEERYYIDSHLRNIERLKRTRWGTPVLSANIGLSSSASDFKGLRSQIGKDYGSGINFSLSLSGLTNNNRELTKSRLQCENMYLTQRRKTEALLLNIIENLSSFDNLKRVFLNNKSKEQLLLDKLSIAIEQYRLHRMLFDDLVEIYEKILQVKISLIENVRDAYLLKTEIEKRITY